MDRRSWPWKKKSSDKTVTTTDINNTSLTSSAVTKTDQDDTRSVKYIQISVDSYTHLTDLEDQVKTLNEKVSSLNDKLNSAQSEMITKDNLVKQHAKVAEEAVSGWEKAEAEALALKQQLESVTLLKLTVEDRASHLDGALKECMKQVRNVKEEGEQKLHDVVFAKNKQWEKAKSELEAKIVDSEQELLRSSAEISALSRTLQERSNLLMKISDEKSQADSEIELMKSDIESCEREISSLKYELHLISKELEIRNEENNMSMRSAELANKQHSEDAKKITKLEAECQRLRGLVRKKLPGPAALAQMKIEVENLGRDYGENRQCHKENEFLTLRLLAMEEELKMLKEALSKRNSELQASRNLCAKTARKLLINQQKSMAEIQSEISTSMSEDGSCSDSWATALMSEREQNVEKSNKEDKKNRLEIMDDFLEMEKLACISSEKTENDIILKQELMDAISHIHDFVLSVGKEATKIAAFSASVNKVLCNEESLHDFLLALSQILSEKSILNYTLPSDKGSEGETCIDKVTLLENEVASNELCALDSHSSSDPDLELNFTSQKCSLEVIEQLKLDKESMEMDLASCKETLEVKNHQLVEMEQQLSEIRSQLAKMEKSNSLTETQLKCMAESYESMESKKLELETELNLLHAKAEMLETALEEEKNSRQADLARYEELHEQMERNTKCMVCSVPSDVEVDAKVKKEMEIAAAAEKLAECQETIFLLGKQLNSLRPPNSGILEDQTKDVITPTLTTNPTTQRTGCESPLHGYNTHTSTSDTEWSPFPRSPLNSRPQKQRSRSSSSSSSSNTISEKHGRGFSRFFSKGRTEN